MSDASKFITLFDLQKLISKGIGEAHPMPYWVVAEISEMKVNYSGHCYLELVEKGGDNQVPRAKVNAVMWRGQYSMISSYFRMTTGSDLKAGIKVLIKVLVTYHELYGLSFRITDIEPSYTLGEIEARRRETIERLQKEGIYDMNRETEFPVVVQRLAVISSRNAAGYQDFMNELGNNPQGYRYQITLFDAVMQGKETEESVIRALDLVATNMDDFDVVVLIRGGGSQSDLGAFDSYRLCCHLAQFPLPVVTGIGHDKDRSVADLVARQALKTPTAVAVFLGERNRAFETEMETLLTEITGFARDNLRNEQSRLSEWSHLLQRQATARVHESQRQLEELFSAVAYRSKWLLETRRAELTLLLSNLSAFTLRQLCDHTIRLDDFAGRLKERTVRYLDNLRQLLVLSETRVEARNPERILRMGYALLRCGDRTVQSVGELTVGDELTVRMKDGEATARVVSAKPVRQKNDRKHSGLTGFSGGVNQIRNAVEKENQSNDGKEKHQLPTSDSGGGRDTPED